MAQFGRPSTDTTNEGYTAVGGVGSLFNQIDETTIEDADYIRSADTPTSDVYVTKMTAVTDPVSSVNHVIRWRHSKSTAGGAQVDVTVQLRQGYVSEASQGTLIAGVTRTNITDAWVTDSLTLTGGEADAITNYADLFLRFVFNQV